MYKIMFVCHGNICRSPMAEYLFLDKIKELGIEKEFTVKSSATSYEEIGNPVYPPVKKILNRMGINCDNKYAEKLTYNDYDKYDFFICMDERNVINTLKIFNGDKDKKVYKLLEFANENKDVADPYYMGNFEQTFSDIVRGVNGLIKYYKKECKIID